MPEFAIVGDVNIAGSRIIVPVALATVLPGVVVPVSATVQVPGGGTVVVGTVLNAPLVTVQGTVVTAGTISAQVTVGTVTVGGGTIQETSTPTQPTFSSVSATIKGTGGTLYGVLAANMSSLAGTLILYQGGGSVLAQLMVPGFDTRGFMLPNGVAFGSLLAATVLGTLAVTVMS